MNTLMKRELFESLMKIYDKLNRADDYQRLLIKYLITFKDASEEELGSAKEYAVKAAIGAIKFPLVEFSLQQNLLSLSVLTQLEKDTKVRQIFELLKILSEGKLVDYMNYAKSHKDIMTEYDISDEKCIENMRILSLCS